MVSFLFYFFLENIAKNNKICYNICMSKVHNAHRARWQRLRKKILTKHNHLCSNPFNLHNDIITAASEVHHILTAENYPQYFFNVNNLIPLCAECHQYAHKLLRSNPLKYYSYFDAEIRGVDKSLQLFASSPFAPPFLQLSNAFGVSLEAKEEESKCFFNKDKRKYYCSCLRQYRNYPCTKCTHLIN